VIAPRHVRIVRESGGPHMGGAVLDAESGAHIKGVQSVELRLGVRELPTAVVTLLAPEVDVEAIAEARVDPTRLATVLWKRALEARGISFNSNPVLDFEQLPDSEQRLWVGLAEAAFAFVDAFNRPRAQA
jgi:hypothetical protein